MISPFVITAWTLIPMGIAIIGGLIASIYVPRPKIISTLQHFVAGIVIASVSIELLPMILGHDTPWTIGFGFLIGVAVMLLVHELVHFLGDKEGENSLPIGLVTGSAIDLFIDGILIGIAFLAGRASGILIAFSLSLCAFFLTLTVSSVMTQKRSPKRAQYIAVVLISVMLPIGALLGSSILLQLPQVILIETIAFGVAALLYLGVEELLAQAHEIHDTAWVSGAFFLGFLLILLFRM